VDARWRRSGRRPRGGARAAELKTRRVQREKALHVAGRAVQHGGFAESERYVRGASANVAMRNERAKRRCTRRLVVVGRQFSAEYEVQVLSCVVRRDTDWVPERPRRALAVASLSAQAHRSLPSAVSTAHRGCVAARGRAGRPTCVRLLEVRTAARTVSSQPGACEASPVCSRTCRWHALNEPAALRSPRGV